MNSTYLFWVLALHSFVACCCSRDPLRLAMRRSAVQFELALVGLFLYGLVTIIVNVVNK